MDTKIRSDVRADPPSARAFPEIKHETKSGEKKKKKQHYQNKNKQSLTTYNRFQTYPLREY